MSTGNAEHVTCGAGGARTAQEICYLCTSENTSEVERHGPGQSGADVLRPATRVHGQCVVLLTCILTVHSADMQIVVLLQQQLV